MKQAVHQSFKRSRGLDFISGPANSTLRQIFRSWAIVMVDSRENKCGLTQLLLIQIRNDFRCERVVAQNQRVQISAQRSVDPGDEFSRNVDLRVERSTRLKLLP